MATLTLRTTKGAPLTHVELDANFSALDSDIGAGMFDSGISVSGDAIFNGDVDIQQGNLILRNGDIQYNPRLAFYDLVASAERARFDSDGAFLIGSSVNSQTVNLKVARTGNQHTLFGSKVSNSGQTTRLELGPGGDGAQTGAGLLATQATSNFNDWSLDLFVSNSNDGYINPISIDQNGETVFSEKVTFNDSAIFTNGINVTGGDLLLNGTPLSGVGSVTSVGQAVPTGFTVSGSPVTTSGTLTIGYAGGYSLGLPSNAKQADWDEAYGWGDHSLAGYRTDASRWSVSGSGLGIYHDSGNVGVGTAAPLRTLHVNSSAQEVGMIVQSTVSSSFIDFANSATLQGRTRIGSTDSDNLVFRTATSERMRIDSAGLVGINTISPQALLHVYLDHTDPDPYFFGGGSRGLKINDESITSDGDHTKFTKAGSTSRFSFNNDNGELLRIENGGDLRATGDVIAFYSTSDERAKTDITVIENALDKVSSLRGVQFEYKETGVRSTGLIAQELEKVLPEAVFVTDDDTGMKGVRYQITVGLLVEAIKELKAEIEELKK